MRFEALGAIKVVFQLTTELWNLDIQKQTILRLVNLALLNTCWWFINRWEFLTFSAILVGDLDLESDLES